MKFRPILYKSSMVLALLRHLKTETRRLRGLDEWNRNPDAITNVISYMSPDGRTTWCAFSADDSMEVECPYGEVDDVLYGRETWKPVASGRVPGPVRYGYAYLADGAVRWDEQTTYVDVWGQERTMSPPLHLARESKWRPSIHMPRRASRLFHRIEAIHLQRLQEGLTLEAARAEGIPQMHGEAVALGLCAEVAPLNPGEPNGPTCRDRWDNSTSRENYARLWDEINPEVPFIRNPWAWTLVLSEYETKSNGRHT